MRAGAGDARAVSSGRTWLDNTRTALVRMCEDLVPRLPEGSAREEAATWCAALPGIDTIREAAKTR